MNLNLHKNARTTPAIRQERRESTQSERELAREYHLNRGTARHRLASSSSKCAFGLKV
jgi:hypothetical protein